MESSDWGWVTLLRSLIRAVPRSASDLEELEPLPLEPTVGDVIGGRYLLEEKLGRGGAAVVFRARDQVLDLVVAVKVLLLDELLTDSETSNFQEGLRQEARAALRLTHPNIVRVHTYAEDDGWQYLVMEHVPGPSLIRYRNGFPDRRMPVEQALRVGIALAEALNYAHQLGVVHNDIKPGNVMMSGDVPKVCDFGLARLTDRVQQAKLLAGSPAYMAPERLAGLPGDARSDQYSLGATLFTLLSGRPPFGIEQGAAIRGHLRSPLPASAHVPAVVDRVLRRAMAKDPARRFPSMRALGIVFRDLLAAWQEQRNETIEVESVSEAAKIRQLRPVELPEAPSGTVVVSRRRVRVRTVEVEVGPLFAETTPVTNEQYRVFLEATGHAPPPHWFRTRHRPGLERHPVVGVTLGDARAYAAWAGRRLPTEAEWVALLRGPDGDSRFPWGDVCRRDASCNCPLAGAGDLSPVGARPAGVSVDGVHDLLGNVWEWVEADARLPAPPAGTAVALGASYRHRCSHLGEVPRTELSPQKSYAYLGFRCVVHIPEAP